MSVFDEVLHRKPSSEEVIRSHIGRRNAAYDLIHHYDADLIGKHPLDLPRVFQILPRKHADDPVHHTRTEHSEQTDIVLHIIICATKNQIILLGF